MIQVCKSVFFSSEGGKNDSLFGYIRVLDLGAEPPLKRLWMGVPLGLRGMNPLNCLHGVFGKHESVSQ